MGKPGELMNRFSRTRENSSGLTVPVSPYQSLVPKAAVPRGRKDRLGPCGPCRPSSALRSTAAKGTAGKGQVDARQAGRPFPSLLARPAGSPREPQERWKRCGRTSAMKLRPPGQAARGGQEGPRSAAGEGQKCARLGMLKPLLGKDSVPGSSGVLGPPACVSPPRAARSVISGFSCGGQGRQSGGLPPARGVCHSSSAPGVVHTPVWRSHTKEDGAEVGAAAHREGGAAGVVQEDGGVLPGLRGGSVVSLGAVAPPAQTLRPQTQHL